MKDNVRRVGLFAPTQAEFVGPFRSLEVARQIKEGTLVTALGIFHGFETVLVRTGIGPENSAAAAQKVFERFNLSEILVIGYGGATKPGLEPGELIGCSEVVDLTGESEPCRIHASSSLLGRARRTGLLSTLASAATVARVICSAREKQALGRTHGVGVVEMEGFPILKLSRARQVPALMIRAVLDTADEDLPNTTELVTEAGEPRLQEVLGHLTRRPSDAAIFSTLRKRTRACRRRLDEFLKQYLVLKD